MTGPPGVGKPVEGLALVCPEPFSARYDLDRRRGTFSRVDHPLYGSSIAGRVLVFPTAKGGVATAWALLDLSARGLAPLALIFGRANPVMVQGAVLAKIAIVHELSPDPLTVVQTGTRLRVDPVLGIVEVVEPRQ